MRWASGIIVASVVLIVVVDVRPWVFRADAIESQPELLQAGLDQLAGRFLGVLQSLLLIERQRVALQVGPVFELLRGQAVALLGAADLLQQGLGSQRQRSVAVF